MNQLLLEFSYLQILDFLTTVAFLMNGVHEGNPLVRLALQYGPDPLGGLLFIKLAAIALGVYCWVHGRKRLLNRMNYFFALIVAWNLAALIFAAAQRA
ncbi:MAG TPA: DUF5658 family protein [Bryobacteraceae bacterium]|nr:DUF5658 family protein [Bryobacteraceae bacterium]